MGPKVFVSYARGDQDFARQLAQSLAGVGVMVADPAIHVTPGQDWADQVMDLLIGSEAVVVLVSSQGTKSAAVLQEIGAARALEKRIVPVQLDDAPLPILLRNTRTLQAGQRSPDQIATQIQQSLAA